ncbi:retinol dehydrogenase 8 [Trichoderma gamsii]|uniref:Retinol dehydrogenase 8 n=2 Tax=Trichoderma gamsii TaxID=398673 RepID=A0A2P5A0I2_9HYPO|nr:retinol dehydrogenase 8 [Trichoderma gamsii]PON30055.1 retinol dehydrogenase 8 [Trichoderma gamsii]
MPATFSTPKKPLTWLITGCSSGFGLSLARVVQANGHHLIASSRNPSSTPDLVSEIESKGGKWIQLDVNAFDCDKVLEELEQHGQPVDVLVNNAGYCIYNPVECFTDSEVRALMETLYFGPSRLIRTAVKHMRQRRFGIIVNMSSGAALESNPSMGAYAAGKGALDSMSKALAKEVEAFNVRVLTVLLGTFNTGMGNATVLGENPPPADYKGSLSEKIMDMMSTGKFAPNGDKDKAMKAVYEVVVGEGVGKGHEAETALPLGQDLAARINVVQGYLAHALDVFGSVCNNVYLEKN